MLVRWRVGKGEVTHGDGRRDATEVVNSFGLSILFVFDVFDSRPSGARVKRLAPVIVL